MVISQRRTIPLRIPSLRTKVLLLLVFLFVAMLRIAGYFANQTREDRIAHAKEHIRSTVRLIAEEQNNTIAYAQQFLLFLAQDRDINEFAQDPQCPKYLAEKLKQEARFTNIALVMPNGDFACAAVPTAKVTNIADRDYFKKALASADQVIGEAVIGRVSGKLALPFVKSMRDDTGQVRGAFFVALDLAWLGQHFAKGGYPPDARIVLADNRGLILARYPDPDRWAGRYASGSPVFRAVLAHGGAGEAEENPAQDIRPSQRGDPRAKRPGKCMVCQRCYKDGDNSA